MISHNAIKILHATMEKEFVGQMMTVREIFSVEKVTVLENYLIHGITVVLIALVLVLPSLIYFIVSIGFL